MELYMIRHGQTEGNKEKRFIGGQLDQGICEAGMVKLLAQKYEKVEAIYSSPMKRCVQTAGYIYGCDNPVIIEELRECNFGDLEGKNHAELEGDSAYEEFVASGGKSPYPGGESMQEFAKRSLAGVKKAVHMATEQGYKKIGLCVHGGTIMAVLYSIVAGKHEFYDWYVENGEGYQITIEEEKWSKGVCHGTIANCIGNGVSP